MPGYGAVLAGVVGVHLLAMMSPGPNVLMVTQTAIASTRRAGVLAALGIAAGAAVWSTAAVLGLQALFAQAPWVSQGLRVVGGLYLLYLGVRFWRRAGRGFMADPEAAGGRLSDWQAFRRGVLINLTNPKALIFYGSIFAALLSPGLPGWVKATAIGLIVVNSIGWHIALALLFSTPRAQQAYQRLKRKIDLTAGAAFGLLGIHLLASSG